MNSKNKTYYLREIHLFQAHDAYFAFLVTSLHLYQLDKDTYERLQEWSEKHGTALPIDNYDEELVAAGILYEADEPEAICSKSGLKI